MKEETRLELMRLSVELTALLLRNTADWSALAYHLKAAGKLTERDGNQTMAVQQHVYEHLAALFGGK